MTRRWLVASIGLVLAATASGAELTGSYRLVEQRYQQGQANRLGPTPPTVTLEVAADGKVWLRSDEAPGERYPWPSWVGDRGALSLREVSATADPLSGTLAASYSVVADDRDSFVLRVEERYALSRDGRLLEGTMKVRFERDDRSRGGFTLTRRFERE